MYRIRSEDYVPLPRPATSDRIVAAHYYAAWKKGAPGLHNGFDDLHGYPERTPLMASFMASTLSSASLSASNTNIAEIP